MHDIDAGAWRKSTADTRLVAPLGIWGRLCVAQVSGEGAAHARGAEDLLDPVHIDGLGEMVIEPGGVGALLVLALAPAGNREEQYMGAPGNATHLARDLIAV